MKYEVLSETLKLTISEDEDLWYLSLLLEPGDIIFADVYRRTEDRGDKIRSKKTGRERIRVGIKLESFEFLEFSGQFHLLGKIVSGPEDYLDSYQSVNVQKGSEIEIIPVDRDTFIEKLKGFEEFNTKSSLVLSVDDEIVSLYKITETTNIPIFEIDRHQGKQYETANSKWLEELKRKLSNYSSEEIFLIGPSMFKEQLIRELKGFNLVDTNVSQSREEGIRELLQSGITKLRKSFENEIVATFLKKIGSNMGIYGMREILNALDMRAVDILLMTDKFFREKSGNELFKKCKEGGCKIFVLHSDWETGKIVQSFGGIAAVLRYRI